MGAINGILMGVYAVVRREENDPRNYFMINLEESMVPGRDQTLVPWICNQTLICSQTH